MILDEATFINLVVGISGRSHVLTPNAFLVKCQLLREGRVVESDI